MWRVEYFFAISPFSIRQQNTQQLMIYETRIDIFIFRNHNFLTASIIEEDIYQKLLIFLHLTLLRQRYYAYN